MKSYDLCLQNDDFDYLDYLEYIVKDNYIPTNDYLNDDYLIDVETINIEKKFMFMLFERIEKLEKDHDAFVKEICDTLSVKPKKVPDVAKDLHAKLVGYYTDLKSKQNEIIEKRIKELAPDSIIGKVPSHLFEELLSSIERDPKEFSFTAYYAFSFIEQFKNIDKEFVDWYSQKLGV